MKMRKDQKSLFPDKKKVEEIDLPLKQGNEIGTKDNFIDKASVDRKRKEEETKKTYRPYHDESSDMKPRER